MGPSAGFRGVGSCDAAFDVVAALRYVSHAGVLAYGAYFAIQQKEVLKYDKEVRDISSLIQRERERAAKNTALISEHEERLQELTQQENGLRLQLGKAQERLAAAEKEVQKLTTECNAISSSRDGALSRLSSLRNDNLRVQEALTLGEKSLQAAQQKAQQARSLLNPLNHPSFAGKKH